MADEIILELWQIKDDIASMHNYDLKKLVKYLQEKKRNGEHEVVDPRSIKKAADGAREKSSRSPSPTTAHNGP